MLKKNEIILLGIALLFAFFSGYIFRGPTNEGTIKSQTISEKETGKTFLYACPMLCTVVPEPGKCPVCGMVMQQIKNQPELELSERALKLAEIEVAPVERKLVQMRIPLIGKIAYNESNIARITADFPGRIDKLYIDYVGMFVNKGDHMADLFSPDLIVLHREFQIAKEAIERYSKLSNARELSRAKSTLESVKKKMRSWRFTEEQIKDAEHTKKISNITIKAPVGGIVIKKYVFEGDYFKTSDLLFMIGDLENLWLMLDVYESDIQWLYYGQKIEFNVEAYPGEVFTGKLVYIYPEMNNKTRTVQARVNIKNRKGHLKPGMFVHANAVVTIGNNGRPIKPSYAGKWLCPMHQEIIQDKAGKCSICGMPLLEAEKLTQIPVDKKNDTPPLVIPATAPLITGKRAVVYVEKKPGIYTGKEIAIGPKCGNYYVVLDGLKEGEKVVVNGNFKLDSEMQISAKMNMMSDSKKKKETKNESKTPELKVSTEKKKLIAKKQTICPVMKLEINPELYIDVKGKRIYVCCPPCTKKIKANPDKYIQEMERDGILIEKAP